MLTMFTGIQKTALKKDLLDSQRDLGYRVRQRCPEVAPLLDYLGDPVHAATGPEHIWEEPCLRKPGQPRHRKNTTRVLKRGVVADLRDGRGSYARLSDEVFYKKHEALCELLRDLERMVVNGLEESTPDGCPPGVEYYQGVRGIIPTISTNSFSAIDYMGWTPDPKPMELTQFYLDEALRRIAFRSGSRVDTIVCNGDQMFEMDKIMLATMGPVEATPYGFADVGRVYESKFGPCHVVLCRTMPLDTVLLLNKKRVAVVPRFGNSFHYSVLNSRDDYESGVISGEYTVELKDELSHGMIRGLEIGKETDKKD
jgi:hypothetical protein